MINQHVYMINSTMSLLLPSDPAAHRVRRGAGAPPPPIVGGGYANYESKG